MSDGPYRSNQAVEERRCLFCGGAVDESTNLCVRCQTGAAPASGVGGELSLLCPRCHVTMTPVHLARACVTQCSKCHGCFVSPSDWSDLVLRACGGDAGLGVLVPPPPGQALLPDQLFAQCACPLCAKSMERVTFAARTKITIDVCAMHGDWFDAGELVSCAQYVQSREARGGRLSEEEIAEELAWEQRIIEIRLEHERLREAATLEQRARTVFGTPASNFALVGELIVKSATKR